MKAVRFHRTGDADVLVVEDVPTPSPQPGEVLARVEAAGVNFADTMRRRGAPYPERSPLPFMPGADVAGSVDAVGEGVGGFTVGEPVFAATRCGGYAQYVCVPARSLVPRPPELSATDATSLLVQGLTAALVLRHAGRLGGGERVVVEAAAGSVGSFAVQLARLFGASQVMASPAVQASAQPFCRSVLTTRSTTWSVPGRVSCGKRRMDAARTCCWR